MATVINNPQPVESNNNSGTSFLLGVILLIIVGFLFFYYGLPMISSYMTPQVNVPNKINVDVHGTK